MPDTKFTPTLELFTLSKQDLNWQYVTLYGEIQDYFKATLVVHSASIFIEWKPKYPQFAKNTQTNCYRTSR